METIVIHSTERSHTVGELIEVLRYLGDDTPLLGWHRVDAVWNGPARKFDSVQIVVTEVSDP